MRARTTLLLALVAIGLGLWVYLVEKPGEPPADTTEALIGLKPEEIARVELALPGAEPIVLERGDGAWMIRSPLAARADANAVDGLVHALTGARVKRSLEASPADAKDAPVAAARFGLDEPAAVVTLSAAAKTSTPLRLAVGDATPIGDNAYVRRGESGPVLVTAGTLRPAVQRTLDELRDRNLLALDDADVIAVVLTRAGATVRIVKDGDAWMIREPFAARADTPAMTSLLSSLRALRAERFLDDADATGAAAGLLPPQAAIAVELADGSRRTLELGAPAAAPAPQPSPEPGAPPAPPPAPQLHARVAGTDSVVTIAQSAAEGLSRSADDLRDRTVLAFNADDAATIEVERADGKGFTLKRAADGWTLGAADVAAPEADRVAADRLASDLATLRGDQLAGPASDAEALGLDPAAITITVSDAAGKPLGRVRTSTPDPETGTPARALAEGGEVAFTLREWVLERLDKTAADFQPAAAAPSPVAD